MTYQGHGVVKCGYDVQTGVTQVCTTSSVPYYLLSSNYKQTTGGFGIGCLSSREQFLLIPPLIIFASMFLI